MYWADKIAQTIIETGKHQPYWVDDMKTPSGRIHVGSLRGVLVHDFVHKALLDAGKKSTFTYVYNDMDPMDGLPGYLDASVYSSYMGKPLFKIPAPEGQKPISQYYADEFTEVFNRLGAHPTVLWSSKLYLSGHMNPLIKIALDKASLLREVYKDVAHYEVRDDWYPFQVFCEKCGREGSTTTYKWDGEYVYYRCEEHKVEWTKGCGYEGKVSPFNGSGKLLWKVDWPAHWTHIGVTIEGAGKDHTSAGGSRDMAREILKRVFNYPEPYDIPYEWLLIRGAKMSSSKGVGASAKEFADLLPPSVGRFLFARTHCNTVIDFDLAGNTIPDLFDEYDRCARAYYAKEKNKFARMYEVSQVLDIPSHMEFLPRFRDIAMYSQMPSVDLYRKFEEMKGKNLTPEERNIVDERVFYAKKWIKSYAPPEINFQLSEDTSATKIHLDDQERTLLETLITMLQKTWEKPEDFQYSLFEEIKRIGMPTKKAFAIIYQILLGKSYGPKIAWFLLNQDGPSLIDRFRDILLQKEPDAAGTPTIYPLLKNDAILSFSHSIKATYPSIVTGVAIIRGLTIQRNLPALEDEKKSIYENLKSLTVEQIGAMPEVVSYRQLYKQTGVDWHSRRPSPEALLRRIAQGRELYSVNTCVDAYNLIVLKNHVSVGAFDLTHITLPTQLKVATGGERILLLGNAEETEIKAGEVFYADEKGPYNLDFNYRDAKRTAVTEKTTDILINVDGVNSITREKVEITLKETIEIIQKYCGGTLEAAGVVTAT